MILGALELAQANVYLSRMGLAYFPSFCGLLCEHRTFTSHCQLGCGTLYGQLQRQLKLNQYGYGLMAEANVPRGLWAPILARMAQDNEADPLSVFLQSLIGNEMGP